MTWQQNLVFCICAFYNIAKEKKDGERYMDKKWYLFSGSFSFFNNTSYFTVTATASLAGKGILVVLCGSDEIRTSAVMNRQWTMEKYRQNSKPWLWNLLKTNFGTWIGTGRFSMDKALKAVKWIETSEQWISYRLRHKTISASEIRK